MSTPNLNPLPHARANPQLRLLDDVPAALADEDRIAAFGRAIEALRAQIEAELGEQDAEHIRRIGRLSRGLEIFGRSLIHIGFDPLTLGAGTLALWAHKMLELTEIGHLALHGAYDGLAGADRFQSANFHWKAPIDESSWKLGHNVRHHQFTNIAGKDPDLNFGGLRLSARIPHRRAHELQPVSNFLSWLGFASAINLHVTGMLDVYLKSGASEVVQDRSRANVRRVQRTFLSKWLRYHGREYGLFPLLAGPFFAKVLLANLASEVGRDVCAAAIIYCGHVGARDYPAGWEPASRADWYAMQVEAARDVELPEWASILCGALDRQIEHHLFPRLPPNRLRQIAPRVRAICEEHGVRYLTDNGPRTLRAIMVELRRLRSSQAA
jgi:NADPH-dependent stearoyl-CoA 9-desaturase